MSHRRFFIRFRSALLVAVGCLLSSSVVFAREMNDAERREARERFDRGLVLFNQGDGEGALAEFSRAYEISESPVVLWNLARVFSSLGQPVAAVEALETLRALSSLPDARRAEVHALFERETSRVATIEVECAVPEARLELDGVEVGPLVPGKPLRVAAGRALVGVLAVGYHPMRRRVTVAGREVRKERFDLEPLAARAGRIALRVSPAEVLVLLDGEELGSTSKLNELVVAPGQHQLALVRAGYRRVEREVVVAEGGLFELEEVLVVDDEVLSREGGRLRLRASEEGIATFLDGQPFLAESTTIPGGVHELRVEKAGFFPVTRRVDVPRGGAATVEVTLAPTPEYREAYVASARSTRLWGYVVGGVGLAALGGGVAYIAYNASDVSRKQSLFDEAFENFEECSRAGTCRPTDEEVATITQSDLDQARGFTPIGYALGGVGLAGVGVGVALLVFGDDPGRYEPKPESDVFGALRIAPWGAPGGAGFSLSGRF